MKFRRLALPTGLHVGCLDAGASRLSGAPPLVLLHGIGADHGEWALTLRLFARGRRVVAMDLLGHGRSDKPAGPGVEYRIRLLADAVVDGIEALPDRPERVDLLGHSLGGAVALDVVRRYPRLVRRLILVDTAGQPVEETIDVLAASLPFVPGSYADARRLLSTSVNSRFLGHPLVALAATLYKGRRKNRPQLMKLVASMAAGEDAVKPRDLARIPHETLVVWGDRDRIFPLAAGHRLVRGLPNARLEVLPRCGHVPPTERPVAFARRVIAFLDA
ncbi:MAG TPA: alpha/beta fold hydrolase [Thermoanaerobaculia bacterium]|nr:alpha/beta fold hydrolase [Thermoanaerobaculia bacterium]